MHLSDEQADTARALGCRFIAATEAQVRQFSMQRRVFIIGGEPFLAARKDGFYETAGTLQALIEGPMRERSDAAAAPAPEPPEPEPPEPEPPEPVAPEAAPPPEAAEAEPPEAPPPPPAPPPAMPTAVAPVAAMVPASSVMAATVTILNGYARRGTLDTPSLTALLASVHGTLRRLR